MDDPSLDDVAARYPDWSCFRGADQLYYAQLKSGDPPVTVCGEDPLDLRDQIQGAIYRALL